MLSEDGTKYKIGGLCCESFFIKDTIMAINERVTHSFLDNEHLGAIVYYRTAHSELS